MSYTPPNFPPAHDNETIVKSDVFRLLNHMIDRKVAEIKMYMAVFEDQSKHAKSPAYGMGMAIGVRLRDENLKPPDRHGRCFGEEVSVELPMSLRSIGDLKGTLEMIASLEKEVGDLTRQKLRLLNDHDFTHSDPAEQIAVFGPAPVTAAETDA
jgi:hypothetical protein